MIEDDLFRERRADYAANVLWSLTGAVFSALGGKFEVKSWGDIQEPPAKEASGDDIRELLEKRWGGGE